MAARLLRCRLLEAKARANPTASEVPLTKGSLGSMETAISSSDTLASTWGSAILPWHGEGGRMTQKMAPACPSAEHVRQQGQK